MATVPHIRGEFEVALAGCRALFAHCLDPQDLHTEAGVESAFLDAFKAWEVFLEDLTIAYLTGEPDVNGASVPSIISTTDPERCRNLINSGRGFVSWADPAEVRRRFGLYFTEASFINRFADVPELRQMATCRNAIAHSSDSASGRLHELWLTVGGVSKSPLRSADVLLMDYPLNPPMTWFDRYLYVLEALSVNLTQVESVAR